MKREISDKIIHWMHNKGLPNRISFNRRAEKEMKNIWLIIMVWVVDGWIVIFDVAASYAEYAFPRILFISRWATLIINCPFLFLQESEKSEIKSGPHLMRIRRHKSSQWIQKIKKNPHYLYTLFPRECHNTVIRFTCHHIWR